MCAYPVVDPDDDNDLKPQCQLHLPKYKKRLQLLMAAHVIIWDESFGNHKDLIESFLTSMIPNQKLFWIFIGDTRQCLPIIKYGSVQDIIESVFIKSIEFYRFEKIFLTENKRLQYVRPEKMLNKEFKMHFKKQKQYEDLLLLMGAGIENKSLKKVCYIGEIIDTESHLEKKVRYVLPEMKYFLNDGEDSVTAALKWLSEDGYNPKDNIILSVFNERVDYWNNLIQQLNPKELFRFKSHDQFADVDDDKKILSNMLTSKTMNHITNSQVPNHEVLLKVDDICFIMRPLRQLGLASNSRVRIVSITKTANGLHPKTICVQTLDDFPRTISIPRICFKFKPKFKSSYNIIRIQFPLKLAYAITNNKSMGQSTIKTLYDVTGESFSHGQVYVGFSRNRIYNNLRLFINKEDCIEVNGQQVPTVINCLYPSVIMKENEYKNNITSDNDIINYYDYCNAPENFIYDDSKSIIDKTKSKNMILDNVNSTTELNANNNDDNDEDGEDLGYESNDHNSNDSDDEDELSGNFIDHDNICESETDDSSIDSSDESDMSVELNEIEFNSTNFEFNMKNTHKMRLINVESDGNCFFHAIAHQLSMYNKNKSILTHFELRTFATTYMNENKDMFVDYFSTYDENIDVYINEMSQSNMWADNHIIQALCNCLNFDIHIYPDTAYRLPITITTDKNLINRLVLNVAYVNQNHYMSLQYI